MPDEYALKGQDAFDLYKQGIVGWNDWVKDHKGWKIDFSGWDFSSETMIDFQLFHFPRIVLFTKAKFGDGDVNFSQTTFGEGNVDFDRAEFGKGKVDFSFAKFGEGKVNFSKAKFGEGGTSFRETNFGNGDVFFNNAEFGDGDVNFHLTNFGNGDVFFSNAEFGDGIVDFGLAEFGEGNVFFELVKFFGGAHFSSATFAEGNVSFNWAKVGTGGINFSEAKFGDGNTSFVGAELGNGEVNFRQTKFGNGDVVFSKAEFGEGVADFYSAKFGEGNVSFHGCVCRGPVYFDNVDIGRKSEYIEFSTMVFKSSVSLDDSTFHIVPDFRHTIFEREITIEGMTVKYKSEPHAYFFRKARSSNDSSHYRKLKKLATEAKDHQRELDFYCYELRAKYVHALSSHQYFLILLYDVFSNFGRSMMRPIFGLLVLWLLASEMFYSRSWESVDGTRTAALWLSASNLLPFISWGREFQREYIEALYGYPPKIDWMVNAIAYTEGLLSLVFLFLIGLAFRNKFRL